MNSQAIDSCLSKLNQLTDLMLSKDPQLPQFTTSEYISIYTQIYDLCLDKETNPQEKLYKTFQEQLKIIAEVKINQQLRESADILGSFVHSHFVYEVFSKILIKFFQYLDKSYAQANQKLSLKNVSEQIFVNKTLEAFKPHIFEGIIFYISEIRKQHAINSSNLTQSLGILKEYFLSTKQSNLKGIKDLFLMVLQSSFEYYQQIYLNEKESPCNEYLKKVFELKEIENQLLSLINFDDLVQDLKRNFNLIFLENYKPILLRENGLYLLFKNNDEQSLQLMYNLYHDLNDYYKEIRVEYKKHLKNQAETQIQQFQNEKQIIKGFFNFYKTEQEMLLINFKNNEYFIHTFQVSCQEVLQSEITSQGAKKQNLCESLVFYLDKLLIQGEECNEEIKQVIEIFYIMPEKDNFLSLYQHLLSLRIVSLQISHIEFEKSVINQIKQICGNQVTKKMENMIQDYYNSALKTHNYIKLILNPLVLYQWDHFKQYQCNLVDPLLISLSDQFEQFFYKNNSNVKLIWLHPISHFIANLVLKGQTYTLTLTYYQFVILNYLFNLQASSEISYIYALFNVEQSHIDIALESLIQKQLIFKNENNGFQFNDSFVYNKSRVYLLNQQKFVHYKKATLQLEREFAVEAVIVKNMKIRQRMSHESLIKCVKKEFSLFEAEEDMINQFIEKLINQEYIIKDENTPGYYIYLA